MKRTLLLLVMTFVTCLVSAQKVKSSLTEAFGKFEQDAQLKSGIASLYVINAATGEVVFEKNSATGLAPASTQKIITAATAYELLGKDYRYKTEFGYSGSIVKNHLRGDIIIRASGDPSLGSWRWKETSDSALIQKWTNLVLDLPIKSFYGDVRVQMEGWDHELIPDGWIWEDIGNYYGAGAGGLNWRENQYDIVLFSGAETGSEVKIVRTRPGTIDFNLVSKARAAAKGSGDNAYVYYPLGENTGVIRGTIPVEERAFKISASYPDPVKQVTHIFGMHLTRLTKIKGDEAPGFHVLDTHYSPILDSLIYWFNRRSINLYGEAFVKTIAHQNKGQGSTEEGIKLLKDHWKQKGVDPIELNMVDGSGLSPLNRVTTKAQVSILQYARKQNWFPGFYLSLPEFNSMKMKSGTIRGVKGFCGYHKAKDGSEYIFSFIVNNYNGSSSSLVQKMYKVLDELK